MRKKAQLFSIDLLIGFFIVLVLLMSILTFNHLYNEKIISVEDRSELETIARSTASLLMYSPGDPVYWDIVDVSEINSVGLSAGRNSYIDIDKVLALRNISNNNYTKLKELLGTAGLEVYIEVRTYEDIGGMFDENEDIAYTYGDGGPEEGDANHSGLRSYLEERDISFTNYFDDWEGLISNISKYGVAIFENTEVDKVDLSAEQETALQDWVNAGGIALFKQFGTMFEVLGLDAIDASGDENGTVLVADDFLKDVVVGDKIYILEGHRLNKNKPPGYISVVKDGSPSAHSLIGRSNIGLGKVYYLPDTEGAVFHLGNKTSSNVRDVFDLPTGTFSYTIGMIPTSNSTEVVSLESGSYFTNGMNGIVRIRLWK